MKLIIPFLFFVSLIHSQEHKRVDATILNVRNGPGQEFEIVDKLVNKNVVKVIFTENGWSKIDLYKEGDFYVSAEYLVDVDNDSNSDLAEEFKYENYDEEPKEENDSKGWIWFLIILGGAYYFFFRKKNKSNHKGYPKSNTTSYSQSKKNPTYLCECCGQEYKSLKKLTWNKCNQSPTGKHIPYSKGVQPIYYCKYCGYKNQSLKKLTWNRCPESPSNKHKPL